jgi:hypothetical protein
MTRPILLAEGAQGQQGKHLPLGAPMTAFHR